MTTTIPSISNAPVALFTYERLDHLSRTIEALLSNDGSSETELFVFSDGAKSHNVKRVEAVRRYITTIQGFKSVKCIFREENIGLAANIRSGINQVLAKHDRVIVLEDDIVTSPQFLKYMNLSLNTYKEIKTVGHINSWSYPAHGSEIEDYFFTDLMNCWGWGTWRDRWALYNDDKDYWMGRYSWNEKYKIDLNGSGEFWPQLTANLSGAKTTWAIFWFLSLIDHGLLSLTPKHGFSHNIGNDGTGDNSRKTTKFDVKDLNESSILNLPSFVILDEVARQNIARYINKSNPYIKRILKKARSLLY